MIVHILEGYGAISALSTVAFLIWGWASGSPRRFAPRDDGSTRAQSAQRANMGASKTGAARNGERS